MHKSPTSVDGNIASPSAKWISTSEQNGEMKIKLLTLAVFSAWRRAICHRA